MKILRYTLALAALLCAACSAPLEPGLYHVRCGGKDGWVRIGEDAMDDSLVFYADSSRLRADTLRVFLKRKAGKRWMVFPDGTEGKVTGTRYKAPEFHKFNMKDSYLDPKYGVRETPDVVFGRVLRGRNGEPGETNLTMDLYIPLDNRPDARPLLVTFHGGSFREGDKRDSLLVEWNRYFASLGYVVSSVNYRVGHRRTEQDTDDAMFHALRDANAAVRFLLKRDSLLIHSGRIFAAGADAGAITALNLAYFREENFPLSHPEGDSVRVERPKLVRGFDVRAVANLWGAVPDTSILLNARIPVISFQDRSDPEVPFWTGHPYEGAVQGDTDPLRSMLESILSVFLPASHPFREMYGAGVIHRILRERGVPEELHAFDLGRHNLFIDMDGYVDYPQYDEIKEQTAIFFASKMVTSPVSLRQDPEDEQLFLIDDSEVKVCSWQVEGGVVLGKSDDTIRVLMFPGAPVHSVTVSGMYSSGISFCETVSPKVE